MDEPDVNDIYGDIIETQLDESESYYHLANASYEAQPAHTEQLSLNNSDIPF